MPFQQTYSRTRITRTLIISGNNKETELQAEQAPNSFEMCSFTLRQKLICLFWCDFDRASSLICGNKLPTRCNRGFYCRSYCLLNMFRVPLYPKSGAQEYYTVVAACGISCCGFSSCWSGVELRVMCPVLQCKWLLGMPVRSWPAYQAVTYTD